MTTDFKTLWRDPSLPNRERKRLLAYVIEDVTLMKLPAKGTTTIHVRFKGGKTETLTSQNPKSSAQQVKTQPKVVELVDRLLDDHIYSEIADILNEKGTDRGRRRCLPCRTPVVEQAFRHPVPPRDQPHLAAVGFHLRNQRISAAFSSIVHFR